MLNHRRNNRRDRGRLVPQLLGWGTNNVLVPKLFGRSVQKARNFTASSHLNAGFSVWVFKKFPGVILPEPHSGRGRPLPHPTPSPTGFLQCFDTVSLVIWPVKIVPDMTCNVFGGTLNLAQSAQPAFDRERGASAPMLGPKPWSPSTFQPWLRPC